MHCICLYKANIQLFTTLLEKEGEYLQRKKMVPGWFTPVMLILVPTVALFFSLVGSYYYRAGNAALNLMFSYNIVVEAVVTTRGQFNTSPGLKLALAYWAFSAAVAIVFVTFFDVYFSIKNNITMQGRKMLIERRNNQAILAEPNQNGFENYVVEGLRIALKIVRNSSWEDRARIAASIIVLLLRSAELVSRHLCKVNVCTILQNGISAVPLVLAVLSLSKRIFRKFDPSRDRISLLFVGNFQREGINVPNPSSDLWRGCMATGQMTLRASRTFDIWSADFRATSGPTMHFTMMEMRQPQADRNVTGAATPWYFPAVDFVILHFSVLDRASYNAMRDIWRNSVKDHIKNSRVIVVGTDTAQRNVNDVTVVEGYQLAYHVRAITYLELPTYGDVGMLFVNIMQLTH
ncbi:hypothetical protein P3S67_011455 [Capsicum chacoense]